MLRTIIASAAAISVNAITIRQETVAVTPAVAAIEEVVATGTSEEILAKVENLDFTVEDMENAIEWAGENDIGLEHVEKAIEGAEAHGDFDKHDIKEWVLKACEKFEVSEENLGEMLEKVGEALDINAEEGEALLEKAGEAFDITEEEFNSTMEECFKVGAEAGEKKDKKSKKAKKTEEAPVEPATEATTAPVEPATEATVAPVEPATVAALAQQNEVEVVEEEKKKCKKGKKAGRKGKKAKKED